MINAKLYSENNAYQKKATSDILREFSSKIKWKRAGARIIDIGCGDGSVTTEVLKMYIPKNYTQLLGCDKNDKMIHLANDRYKGDKSDFIILNIEHNLPNELTGNFDHAFSSFVMHWVSNQKLAFTNIYNLLNDEGDCLLIFVEKTPVYDIWRTVAQLPRWKLYLQEVERFIGPYHDLHEPKLQIKEMMEDIGFVDVKIDSQQKTFKFNTSKELKNFLAALDIFSIPENEFEEYLDDCVNVLRKDNSVSENNEQTQGLYMTNKFIIAYGSK